MPRPIASCASSSTACRWSPTSRPTRCRPSATALERFARFLGFADRDAFAAALLEHLRKVQRHYARLFEDAPAAEASRRALAFPPDKDDTETLDKLAAMGFRRPLEVSQAVRRWLAGEYRSLKSEFARAHLAELVPVLIDQLARAENPDQRAGRARPLSRRPAWRRAAVVAAAAQSGSRRAARARRSAPRRGSPIFWRVHPQVMDALIEPSFFGALPDAEKLAAELDRHARAGARPTRICSTARASSARSTCS